MAADLPPDLDEEVLHASRGSGRRGRRRARPSGGSSGSMASARARPTRWRMPPDSSCGRLSRRRRSPTLAQHLPAPRPAAPPPPMPLELEAEGDVLARPTARGIASIPGRSAIARVRRARPPGRRIPSRRRSSPRDRRRGIATCSCRSRRGRTVRRTLRERPRDRCRPALAGRGPYPRPRSCRRRCSGSSPLGPRGARRGRECSSRSP